MTNLQGERMAQQLLHWDQWGLAQASRSKMMKSYFEKGKESCSFDQLSEVSMSKRQTEAVVTKGLNLQSGGSVYRVFLSQLMLTQLLNLCSL
jgi:hypothetical protein